MKDNEYLNQIYEIQKRLLIKSTKASEWFELFVEPTKEQKENNER